MILYAHKKTMGGSIMVKTFQRGLALLLAVLTICGCFVFTVSAEEAAPVTTKTGSYSSDAIAAAAELLGLASYESYSKKHSDETLYPRADATITVKGTDYIADKTTMEVKTETFDGIEALSTGDSGVVAFKVNVPKTAKYAIRLNYWPIEGKSNATSIQRILKINDTIPFFEAYNISMTKVWSANYDPADENALADGTVRRFNLDIDNNELRAPIVQTPKWCSYEVKDADGFYKDPFEFVLQEGENILTLESVAESIAIASIEFFPKQEVMSYEEYSAKYAGKAKGTSKVKIEAETPSNLSTPTIYPVEDRSSAATSPCDTTRVLLNTLGGEKWQVAGQWVEYTFSVDADGMYRICPRFRQNVNDGIYSSRMLYIYSDSSLKEGDDGYYAGSPFDEARELRFNYGSEWQSTALQFGKLSTNAKGKTEIEYVDCEFFFKAGVTYTIRFVVSLGTMGEIVASVQNSLDAINDDYLNILKLTGADPDESRDYYFQSVMPEVIQDIQRQSVVIYRISEELSSLAGTKSSNTATLDNISRLLTQMGVDPEEEIAKGMSKLKTYIGNLGTWLSNAKTQPLQFDYIMIQSADEKLPVATPNSFKSFIHEIKSFIQSFIRNYDRMGASAEIDTTLESIDVWNAYGRDQAQVIRNLINNDFTPQTGVTVNLKLIAGGTLLPSILAHQGPDAYIGLGEDNVINYAIRGALAEIENFEGFTDMLYYKVDENFNTVYGADGKPVINDKHLFNDAAMLVLGIEDSKDKMHYYGLPETQGFSMMFVRTDVLADLGITSLDTWNDMIEAATVLSQNNMTIGLTTDYKIFLYQKGGTLFADNGMRINLDSNLALDSFETMCNLFTSYSFPYKYDFSNRFRTGEMPIGIAGAIGTYNKLIVFATELRGLWEFVPVPGYEAIDENGNKYINNVAVSTVSAIVMINECDQKEETWKFLKWHVGEKCQVDYANEMIAILGDSAKHSTANINALETMPWTNKERTNLVAQFDNLASIPNYPGSYIIGRYTNFTFLDAYNHDVDPVNKLLGYITIINKEITRKRREFGLESLQIGQTLASKRYYMSLYILGDLTMDQLLGKKPMEVGGRIVVLDDDASEDKYDAEIIKNLPSYALSDADKTKLKNEIDALKKAFADIYDENASFKAYTSTEKIAALKAAGDALRAAGGDSVTKLCEYVDQIVGALTDYQASYPLEVAIY